MASKTIDIHPHVIADDERRYPLDPLGGHQSDWSRLRPVTADRMIAAMDEAGVDKSALVQASTCYGYDNSYVADAVVAHPDRFTGVFSVDVLAADAPDRCVIGSAATDRHAAFTIGSTMHDPGHWIDDPRLSGLADGRRNRPSDLYADVATAFPQLINLVKRFPA